MELFPTKWIIPLSLSAFGKASPLTKPLLMEESPSTRYEQDCALGNNGGFVIEENQLQSPNHDTRRSETYEFIDEQTVRISGVEEDLKINKLADDAMTFDLTPKDIHNESASLLTMVTLKRIHGE